MAHVQAVDSVRTARDAPAKGGALRLNPTAACSVATRALASATTWSFGCSARSRSADEGAALQLGGPKERALLALLLIDAGRARLDRPADRRALERASAPHGRRPRSRTPSRSSASFSAPTSLITQLPRVPASGRARPSSMPSAFAALLLTEARGRTRRSEGGQAPCWRSSCGAGRRSRSSPSRRSPRARLRRLDELRLTLLEERLEADIEAGEAATARRRARGARRRAPAPRAVQGAADARALPGGKAGRGARGVPGRAAGVRRGARNRPEPRAPTAVRVRSFARRAMLEPARRGTGTRTTSKTSPRTILPGRLVAVLGADVAELTLAVARASASSYPDARPRDAGTCRPVRRPHQGLGPALRRAPRPLRPRPTRRRPLHRFLASLPPLLRERGVPHQLFVTTSYDIALERAFEEAGEEFDVVSYIAAGRDRGQLLPRRRPTAPARSIERAEHLRDRALARAEHGDPQAPRAGRCASLSATGRASW